MPERAPSEDGDSVVERDFSACAGCHDSSQSNRLAVIGRVRRCQEFSGTWGLRESRALKGEASKGEGKMARHRCLPMFKVLAIKDYSIRIVA